MKAILFGFLMSAIFGVSMGNAANPVVWSPMTEQEVKQLPSYCMLKYREMRGVKGSRQEGMALLGPQFSNIVHYCSGLNYMNRYYRNAGSRDAKSYLSFAINEFNYMVAHMVKQSPVEAEVFLNRGIAYSLSKDATKSMSDLHRAITLDPKLTRAYMTLADQYLKSKNREKALDVVAAGLRHDPDSSALKRRYDELGGKQPYPEPAVAAPVASSDEVEPQGNEVAITTDQKVIEQPEVLDEAVSKPVEQQSTGAMPIGSPTNPYCRFCPD